MTDDAKKIEAFMARTFRDALKDCVGKPVDLSTVKHEVERVIKTWVKDPRVIPLIEVETVQVVHDAIHFKLKQQSLASQIIPAFKGPFILWCEEDGVVHIAGRLGEEGVRACDYRSLLMGGPMPPGTVLTCLECLTLNIDTGT